MYVDVSSRQYRVDEKKKVDIVNDEPVKSRDIEKELLCYMPIMTRSSFCQLRGKNERELTWAGECTFDQGGYFIINGSEKVIIAQERMSNNHVYVFKKQQPHKYEWVCETRYVSLSAALARIYIPPRRSHIATGSRPTSTMLLNMYGSRTRSSVDGHQIRAMIPYVREEIPVVVIFRALGFVADRDIIEHIVYDFEDDEMMERFRPSLEEASPIQNQIVALDFIGVR